MSHDLPKRLTPEERTAGYAAYTKRYQEIKADLMVEYPHMGEAACGKRAMEEIDEESGFKVK